MAVRPGPEKTTHVVTSKQPSPGSVYVYRQFISVAGSRNSINFFVILLFSAIVAVDIFPLEALTLLIKHCQCTTVVRVGYISSVAIWLRNSQISALANAGEDLRP